MRVLTVQPGRSMGDIAGACETEPTIIELSGDWRAASDHLGLLRALDRAAGLIADDTVGQRLRRAGLRCPTACDRDQLVPVTVEPSPRIEAGRIRLGPGGRRFSPAARPAWDLETARARVSAAKETIIPGWVDYLDAHAERFAQMLCRLPKAPAGGVALDTAIFPVSCRALADLGYFTVAAHYADQGITELHETTEAIWQEAGVDIELRYDAEIHRLPCEPELFDLVIAAEIIEHMPSDPQQFLVDLNRVTRHGGTLLVTTPNVVSQRALALALEGRHPANHFVYDRDGSLDRHHLEYTPDLLSELVTAAGFEVTALETVDVWWGRDDRVMDLLEAEGFDTSMRGDNIYLTAVKRSSFVDRTPPCLYSGDRSEWITSWRNQPRIDRWQRRSTDGVVAP